MDAEWHDHPFVRHLAALGFGLDPYRLTPEGEIVLGLRFLTRDAEIVIKFDRPDTLRVVQYRRRGRRAGVASAFRDFVWLIFEAADPRFGITGVIGVISPAPALDGDTLPADRLAAFYSRHLAAGTIGREWGSDIMYGRIADFLACWKRPRPPVPRPG